MEKLPKMEVIEKPEPQHKIRVVVIAVAPDGKQHSRSFTMGLTSDEPADLEILVEKIRAVLKGEEGTNDNYRHKKVW